MYHQIYLLAFILIFFSNSGMKDFEVAYFHAYIEGVDFVFIDCAIFRHRENDIYGGNRVVKSISTLILCIKIHLLYSIHVF